MATASVVITVQDVNDNDPVFNPKLYETVVTEDSPPGTPVTSVTATDADENPRYGSKVVYSHAKGFGIHVTSDGFERYFPELCSRPSKIKFLTLLS